MGRGSGFSNGLLNTLKPSKKLALKEAIENMNRFGGEWHVVKIGDKFTSVHKEYLRTHGVKSLQKIKSDYAAPIKWYRLPIYWFNRGLAKLLRRWLTKKL